MSGGRIFGFAPSPLSAQEIAVQVRKPRRGVGLVVTANIDHVALLRRDPAFAAAYASAAIITCDGFPVLRYARWRGWATAELVTGCSIAAALFRTHVPGPEHALFCVVDSTATAMRLHRWATGHGLARRLALAVAPPGFQDRPQDQSTLARQIRDHGTTILLMGLGAPRSEVFVDRHRDLLPPCWALCLGQALRIEMGLTRRAPVLWQRLNLEWLWRLAAEPRRLAARYLTATVGFLLAVAADSATHARRGGVARPLLLALLLAGLGGCTGVPPPTEAASATPPPYRLHAGDEVEILFTDTPELNLRQVIRTDGSLAMPMAGDIPAAGLSVPDLHAALEQHYARHLVHPDITVVLRTASANRVFVGGEVMLQGAEPLDAPLTVSRAIILAQGLKPTADPSQVLVIRTDADGRAAARTIDIGRVLAGEAGAPDLVLQPFDVVFVPNSTIARLDRAVDQYIRQLLPTTPTVLYQINPTGTVHP